jgi:hypothetical protein
MLLLVGSFPLVMASGVEKFGWFLFVRDAFVDSTPSPSRP